MNTRRLWIILLVIALLTPLGLWLPARLGARGAWGEWAAEDLGKMVGFVPPRLAHLAGLWKAPAPDYAPPGWEAKPLAAQSAAYIVSALVGVAVCAGAMLLLSRYLVRRQEKRAP